MEPDIDAQLEFTHKIIARSAFGHMVQGNLHTVLNNSAGVSCITLLKHEKFDCSVCKRNKRSLDGTRACGDGFGNVYHHLGGREHFSAHRTWAYGMPFDEPAFDDFTLGNTHGPQRATKGAQARERKAASMAAGRSKAPRANRPKPRAGRATPPPGAPAAAPSPPPTAAPAVVGGAPVWCTTDEEAAYYEQRAQQLQHEMSMPEAWPEVMPEVLAVLMTTALPAER